MGSYIHSHWLLSAPLEAQQQQQKNAVFEFVIFIFKKLGRGLLLLGLVTERKETKNFPKTENYTSNEPLSD